LVKGNNMIFATYNYKEYHNGNKSEWPIQPPTQEAWNIMVNSDYTYCQNHNLLRGANNIPKHHLPSYHPYWQKQSIKNTKNYVYTLIEKLKKCIKDPELYKIEFRKGANYYTVISFDINPIIKREGLKIRLPENNKKNIKEDIVTLSLVKNGINLSWN